MVERLSDLVDLSAKVPDLVKFLRPGEKVINVQDAPVVRPTSLISYHDALCLLTGVNHVKDIGLNGPASGAKALKGQEAALGQGAFDCLFGRDGLYAAEDLMEEFPKLAEVTLERYAELLGMTENLHREEEFGRVFHEYRKEDDPIAKRLSQELGWGWPYYGTVDATPLFVRVLGKFCLSGNRMEFLEKKYRARDGNIYTMFQALQFAMRWIVRRLNSNPQGFLEYRHAFPGSHLNQVMEDSWDSHFHENGNLANLDQGISSSEVQWLVFDALSYALVIYRLFSSPNSLLQKEAMYFRVLKKKLKTQALKHLWTDQGTTGYFAVGTDRNELGKLRVMRVKKCIPAFFVESLISQPEELMETVKKLTRTIFSKEMLAAGGVRSLASDQPRFMPGGYHTGNVWLFQNYKIAQGLRSHKYFHLAAELENRLVKAVEESRMYPEFVHGGTDSEIKLNERIVDTWDEIDKRKNRREQPPQHIQLWTVSAYAAIKFRIQKEKQKTPPPTQFEETVLKNV